MCASCARTGLCGGQRAIAVPTATAKDTKLGREVALKILPDAFARDVERMARFEREARVLAALNHPNIAQIYGVEDRALVMEMVEGETLKGPLPLETALNYAKQIADALEAIGVPCNTDLAQAAVSREDCTRARR